MKRPYIICSILALVWLLIASFLLFSTESLIGLDGYFHVQVAEIMSMKGIFIKEFPYATESIWADMYFDKEWFFHIFLSAFLTFGKVHGAKLAVLVLIFMIVVSLWVLFTTLNIKGKFWWILFLPFCAYGWFWVRLVLCRPHLASIAILFFSISAILKRQRVQLVLLSMLYTLSYAGHWQLLGLILIYDIFYTIFDDEGKLRHPKLKRLPMFIYSLSGMLVGYVVHPNFPNNIKGFYIQTVMVLKAYWSNEVEFQLIAPLELNALDPISFIFTFAPIIIGLLVVVIHAIVYKFPKNRHIYLFAFYTLIYFILTARSIRFLEYFVPVAVMFIALYFQSNNVSEVIRRPMIKVFLIFIMIIFGSAGYAKCYFKYVKFKRDAQQQAPLYADAANWLKENIDDNEIVFTAGFADSSPLFFGAPNLKYLVFLDAYFMYQRSPERFKLWLHIITGGSNDPVSLIRNVFNSRVVFLSSLYPRLKEQLENRSDVVNVYSGPIGEDIYLLKNK